MGSLRVVDNFAEMALQFFHPDARVASVDKSAQKAEPFCDVTVVVANVVLRDAAVDGQKLGHAGGLGEEIGSMAELKSLYNHGSLQFCFKS